MVNSKQNLHLIRYSHAIYEYAATKLKLNVSKLIDDCYLISIRDKNTELLIRNANVDLNSELVYMNCSDKLSMARLLSLHEIPHIPIIACCEDYLGNHEYILNSLGKSFASSFIVKPREGYGGCGVKKCLSRFQVVETIRKQRPSANRALIIQPFYEGTEVRIIVMRGTVISVIERRPIVLIGDGKSTIEQLLRTYYSRYLLIRKNLFPSFTFDNFRRTLNLQESQQVLGLNTQKVFPKALSFSSGGTGIRSIQHPEQFETLAVATATALSAVYCAVDLILTTEGPMVLEVNTRPNIALNTYADGIFDITTAKKVITSALEQKQRLNL